jgi:hypothetical protein
MPKSIFHPSALKMYKSHHQQSNNFEKIYQNLTNNPHKQFKLILDEVVVDFTNARPVDIARHEKVRELKKYKHTNVRHVQSS